MATIDSLSKQQPLYFYSKLSTQYTDSTRHNSFKTSVRMIKDSAMTALITYAGIPIAHSRIGKDTLIILNKREKCYIKQSLDYFKQTFGVDFNYKNIEQVILGMPLDYDSTQKYFQIHDPFQYTVSTHKKRLFKRVERFNRLKEKLKDDIFIKYFLTDDGKNLKGMNIESPSDSSSIQVMYLSLADIGGYKFPNKVEINIKTPRNGILIELDYDKTNIEEPQEVDLEIPEKYEKCD